MMYGNYSETNLERMVPVFCTTLLVLHEDILLQH